MTNIPQVNIWAEAEAFFDSISHADIALRIVAATEAAACGRNALVQPRAARLPTLRHSACPSTSRGSSSTSVRVPGRVVRCGRCGVERPRTRQGSRRSIRFASLDLERIAPSSRRRVHRHRT